MRFLLVIFFLLILSCTSTKENETFASLDEISISYIKLALNVGQYSSDYIDAYYGPEALKPKELSSEETKIFPGRKLEGKANLLLNLIGHIDSEKLSDIEKSRYNYLYSQALAVRTYIQIKSGNQITFEEEAKALYEALPPVYSARYFDSLIDELNTILPGNGEVSKRLEDYKKAFIIPKEKLDTVFKTAIEESKKRTEQYLILPENENFKLEYVTNKPWSGYNWFKGDAYSLIQINTDLPIYIDRAIDLACHEGYPGHHVYHSMIEQELVKGQGWMEFSVYPLFSPQAMISEGSANYGIEVAFPGKERIDFEKKVLFPLAGMDSTKTNEYYKIQDFTKKLSYAGNEAARNYLNGTMNKQAATDWLYKYALMSRERAAQRISFIEKYRSYVISYNLGQDMVKNYIEKKGGTEKNPDKRWELFKDIITKPHTPSELFK